MDRLSRQRAGADPMTTTIRQLVTAELERITAVLGEALTAVGGDQPETARAIIGDARDALDHVADLLWYPLEATRR
jgi:hypothetical protein